MPLTHYGIKEWGTATVAAVCATLFLLFLPWWVIIFIVWLAWFCVAAFFRDPVRTVPADLSAEIFLSPADGTISAIKKLDFHEATDGQPALCIRIFLSVLNVHVNRAPCDGIVVRQIHNDGQYLDARNPDSAKFNESNLLIMERQDEHIGIRQISGAIARRIVCDVIEGQKLIRGEKYGMIKFGSTTELIIPRLKNANALVVVGDKVKAGITPIASLSLHYTVQDPLEPDCEPGIAAEGNNLHINDDGDKLIDLYEKNPDESESDKQNPSA